MHQKIYRQVLTLTLLTTFVLSEAAKVDGKAHTPEHLSQWTADLEKLGWTFPNPKDSTDKIFFRDISIAKIEAIDAGSQLLFLNDDLLVAYHTVTSRGNWQNATRQLEASFFRVKDGGLQETMHWTGAVRKASGGEDSESRIISLGNGRFLVDANGTLMWYGGDFKLIRQQKLEPSTLVNLWGLQATLDGSDIFVRHEILPAVNDNRRSVTYEWHDAQTFELLKSMPGNIYQGRSVLGLEHGIALWCQEGGGTCTINTEGQIKRICYVGLCGEAGPSPIAAHQFGLVGRNGIGVLDEESGLLWSDTVDPEDDHHGLLFGGLMAAASGKRFAVSVNAHRKYRFDSVDIRKDMILVYDTESSKHIFALSARGEFALSSDGRKLAVLEDGRVSLYTID